MLRARRQEEGVDPGQALVHLGHLQLLVEVRDRAQPLDDGVDAVITREIDQQAFEELDTNVGQMLRRFLEHLLAVFEAEQRRRLLRVADHGNDHFVEMPGRAFDDVEVPEGHRIERSRAESDRHAVSPVEL